MHRRLACIAAFVLLTIGVPSALAAEEQRPDDLQKMKSAYVRPPVRVVENLALADLGRDLFFDPAISASGKTACASCHRPDAGWTTSGVRVPGDSGRPTERRAQTLLGIGYARAPFDWDGRHATLEAQAVSSIGTGSMSMFATPHEMRVDDIVARVSGNAAYVEKFERAMPGAPINLDNVVVALAAFERTIEPGEAPFDRWIAGEEGAISAGAKRGFLIFNEQANCAGCHRGWRFTDDEFHDVGTSTTDIGRGRERKNDRFAQFAFKTPTLRSVALRAPYMHDGSVRTLRDVVDHYAKGGIDRPSRSPMMHPLELTEDERNDLVAFLATLTGEGGTK